MVDNYTQARKQAAVQFLDLVVAGKIDEAFRKYVDHSHIVLRPGETGISAVHLFRFEGNKIVEMWDCGQPLPADSPNKDGAF